jgi:hypothetical protein
MLCRALETYCSEINDVEDAACSLIIACYGSTDIQLGILTLAVSVGANPQRIADAYRQVETSLAGALPALPPTPLSAHLEE